MMGGKRWLRGAAVAAALLMAGTAGAETVKIGAILPMTGEAASYGHWMRNGMAIAADEVNAAWKGRDELVIIYEDSKSNPKDAVAAMNKLMAADKVGAVMTTLTGTTRALIPVAEQNKLILTTSATLPGLTDNTRYVFRNATNLGSEIGALVDYTAPRFKKAAVLWANLEWASWGRKAFVDGFTKRGGTVVEDQSFAPDATDLRVQLTKIRAARPDVVLVLAYKSSGLALKQARELGLDAQFVGTLDFELPEVVAIAKQAADGAIYTKALFDPADPAAPAAMSAYGAEYKRRYNEAPEVYSATMYDMVKMLADALLKGGGDVEKARGLILATANYPGASGTTTFLPNGDVDKTVELKTIKDGKYVAFIAK